MISARKIPSIRALQHQLVIYVIVYGNRWPMSIHFFLTMSESRHTVPNRIVWVGAQWWITFYSRPFLYISHYYYVIGIGCPRIIRTCIFPQSSVLRWNHWRCGYQNFMKYSSKGKAKCHTPPKSPHDPVQSLFPVSAEDLLFPLCSSTKQAIIDNGAHSPIPQ